jgi:CDP-diacylglycerol--glycerol-3-phosphate 3-phosphatidyltransferase
VNIANLLTLSRLAATPFVIWLMSAETPAPRYAAIGLFIAAMFTDLFDGYFARKSGPTRLGTFLDPVADKTLILSVLIFLGTVGTIPLWVGLLMMFREFWVSAIRSLGTVEGKVIGANWMGKSKTFLQVVLIVWGQWIFARAAAGTPAADIEMRGVFTLAAITTFLALLFAVIFTWWHRKLFVVQR